ncbi:MAG: UDP-N-acetylmuramate--L-alanine ligase [Deltaproteobacteria bacterium]|nr:UDP-N-acetylmuramate--L-alanine ligase [Deltaproteobacteria bacterium]MBI5809885.1 UDP-N-acetylmuramate--L-alanine ligase [Deltaproteobacteria bacterium]
MYRGRIKRIHFVGIGGSGMNGIAEVLINMGYKVTGSDLAESDTTRRLAKLGAAIHIGHREENVAGAHCVVYSSAVKKDNPELRGAASRQIPIIPRAEMLAELMRMKYGIAIAGTHGKTTTTSMISMILAMANMDPTIVTGGKLNSLGANARLGGGDFLVAEADESDRSFLKLSPTIAVVTNIDREHMDNYSDMEDVKSAYLNFINKVPFYGCAVICLDHPVIQSLIPKITRRVVSYGLTAQADIHARNITHEGMRTTFEIWYEKTKAGALTLSMPGEHNVCNSLAAASVAKELEIDFEHIKAGLEGFTGVERRFHIRGTSGGVTVIDDYGHHPEEIKAVLRAAKKGWGRRVAVVFQPHRYSRTKDLFTEFLSAFNDAEKLIITEIYAAGEERMEGVSGEALYRGIKAYGHKDVSFIKDISAVPEHLAGVVSGDDMVITLGAGDVWKAGVRFLELMNLVPVKTGKGERG